MFLFQGYNLSQSERCLSFTLHCSSLLLKSSAVSHEGTFYSHPSAVTTIYTFFLLFYFQNGHKNGHKKKVPRGRGWSNSFAENKLPWENLWLFSSLCTKSSNTWLPVSSLLLAHWFDVKGKFSHGYIQEEMED